ncbi:lipoprotein-anchoring transpeptidase ErfK/SrfK [Haloactinospora alba]|uniref:Lipoprotein-anchoring transpeptidase ErfK/SrfK n=1 Tax=Haloactinospora alba TaxID=405555 RepID=A0A543NJT1_9ACTN|nr:Ig-like domain-containing protein [Haloactinospora alba]TQN32030.1 lipoprotein-anchoring transpeptidase ErfK/SrfK [Haloactinospora alba]
MKDSAFPTAHRRAGAGLAVLALGLTAACSGSGSEGADTAGAEGGSDPVTVKVLPEDGGSEVRPDVPVTVQADGGSITDVQVEQSGGADTGDGSDSAVDEVTGQLNDDKTEWVSEWNLKPGADVTVTATAENEDGEESEAVSEFSTVPAPQGQRLELVSNFPTSGETVGVGMPVIVNFDLPVENKKQVENSIEVSADEPTQGAWNWFGDDMAVFRPKEYWPSGTEVTVDMHLAGTEASEGVHGIENHRLNFEVGRKQVSTIDSDSHQMTVERDGEQIQKFPVSIGKANVEKYTTTSGTHLTMNKRRELTMDSSTTGVPVDSPEGYKLDVEYAVRFSNSGEFTHAAPWNSAALGEENTSHGCPNMSTEDAKWFYENSYQGDPLVVEGTDRELEVDNGWGYWQRSWDQWLENSATGEPDRTDEEGTPGSVHTTDE